MLKFFKDLQYLLAGICASATRVTCDTQCRRRFLANDRSHIPGVHENDAAFVNGILKTKYIGPVQ